VKQKQGWEGRKYSPTSEGWSLLRRERGGQRGQDFAEGESLKIHSHWAWWCLPVISALGRLRQEDCEFKASLSYIVRTCLKKNKTEKQPK
jgi:hypothetical protein